MQGIILKALSGFYYVDRGDGVPVACRARGKFRHQKLNPLVGDRVDDPPLADCAGVCRPARFPTNWAAAGIPPAMWSCFV